MRNAWIALTLLAAGCSSSQPDMDVVTSQQHQQRTQVVENRRVEVAPSMELVGEPRPLPTPAQPRVLVAPPVAQPSPQATQPPQPTTRQMAQEALDRVDKLEQRQAPTSFEFQVGPPVVINTLPTPAATPSPVYQPPPPSPAPTPVYVAPPVVLETAPGLSYQNGGVNGTTAPLTTATPALPTAEGFEYRP